ncbi:MAG TPA: alcohol dehydrogenase catalytic domain-containing protein [Fimbriimonas sp.]
MRALVYTAVKKVEMRDFPDPQAAGGEVVVRVRATGICGSDLHGFLGHQKRRQPGLVLGHETLGIVESGPENLAGRRVSVNPLLTCGECSACRSGRQNCCRSWRLLGLDTTHGGFAERVAVPMRNVFPLPDHVSDAAAVMVEPLANAIHLLSMVPNHAGLLPSVAIVGAGTLGAAILAVARIRGLNVVLVTETNPKRTDVAKELGAPVVLNPLETDWVAEARRMTDGVGVDVAIDAVGLARTRIEAADAVAKGGTVLLLGLDEGPTTLDFQDLVRREVRLQCSFAYTDRDFAEALSLVVSGRASFEKWTDLVPMDQGQSAFDRLVTDPGDRLKIALVPG